MTGNTLPISTPSSISTNMHSSLLPSLGWCMERRRTPAISHAKKYIRTPSGVLDEDQNVKIRTGADAERLSARSPFENARVLASACALTLV